MTMNKFQVKRKAKYIVWIVSFLILGYGILPVQIPRKWDDKIGENTVLGYYQQTTGGDFFVEKETINSKKIKINRSINEINLTGNTPAKKYGFKNHYEVMMSNFILIGEIVGNEKIENVGEFYVFDVDEFYLTDYVLNFWDSSKIFCVFFALSLIVFPLLSIVLIIEKNRNNAIKDNVYREKSR